MRSTRPGSIGLVPSSVCLTTVSTIGAFVSVLSESSGSVKPAFVSGSPLYSWVDAQHRVAHGLELPLSWETSGEQSFDDQHRCPTAFESRLGQPPIPVAEAKAMILGGDEEGDTAAQVGVDYLQPLLRLEKQPLVPGRKAALRVRRQLKRPVDGGDVAYDRQQLGHDLRQVEPRLDHCRSALQAELVGGTAHRCR